MMSGHGANPIFFNKKKNKDWTSKTLANPHPPTSDNISFLPYLQPPTPLKWTSYVYHPLGVLHNRKGNLGYGNRSKYLAYSIESQVVGFGIRRRWWNSFLDKQLALGYRENSVVECKLQNFTIQDPFFHVL